jgi:hypothetical protein
MDSLGNPYRNYILEYIEKKKVKRASRIPKGMKSQVTVTVIVRDDDLFYVNDALRKYPVAYVDIYRRSIKVTGRITEGMFREFIMAKNPFQDITTITMRFYFTVEGTSESRCVIC